MSAEKTLDEQFEEIENNMNVKRTKVDSDNRPVDVEVLSLGHVKGELANYEWRTITVNDKDIAIKVFKGDAFDHFTLLGKDDIAYIASRQKDDEVLDDYEEEVKQMEFAEQMDVAGFNRRHQDALIVSYILEPKISLSDDCPPGVIPVSALSQETKDRMMEAYDDVNTPAEVATSVERFQ